MHFLLHTHQSFDLVLAALFNYVYAGSGVSTGADKDQAGLAHESLGAEAAKLATAKRKIRSLHLLVGLLAASVSVFFIVFQIPATIVICAL
jgi:hypothetical protein